MISKSEKPNRMKSDMKHDELLTTGSAWPGLLLVVVGIGLLVINLFQLQIPGEIWPFYIVSLGGLLLLPSIGISDGADGRMVRLAGIGSALIVIGLVSFLAELVDHYESWAYAWTLIPSAVIAGRMFARRGSDDSAFMQRGRRSIQILLLAFVGLAIFFELFIFNGYGRWWPILLIAAGAFLLLNPRR